MPGSDKDSALLVCVIASRPLLRPRSILTTPTSGQMSLFAGAPNQRRVFLSLSLANGVVQAGGAVL